MQELNYNIHGLLKIKVVNRRPSKDLNLKHSFFRVDEDISDPDVVLNIGEFKPSNADCDLVSHRYHIKENYFYCKDKGKKMKWEIEIEGLEKGRTIINFFGKDRFLKGLLFPTFLAQDILTPIVEYRLAKKQYFLLHAGAVSKDQKAFIFAGRAGANKTTLIMDLIRKKGYRLLGDDRIIVNKEKVLCYPISLFLFDFMLKNTMTEHRGLIDDIKLLLSLNRPRYRVPVERSVRLSKLFFLSRSSGERGVNVREIEHDRSIDKLVINNRCEYMAPTIGTPSSQFYRYVLAYSLIFPHNALSCHWSRMETGLADALRAVRKYDVEMPETYEPRTCIDLLNLLSDN